MSFDITSIYGLHFIVLLIHFIVPIIHTSVVHR